MFLFINQGVSVDADGFNLNTSHVLIYQIPLLDIALIFLFKYISCSYLSTSAIFSLFSFKNLNTSHVLIYRYTTVPFDIVITFKYISCSYLSNVFTHFLFSIISYIALFFNISQLFYQPPPHFSFSSSLVSFPLIL